MGSSIVRVMNTTIALRSSAIDAGRPIAETADEIPDVDRAEQFLDIGQVGELCIGHNGLEILVGRVQHALDLRGAGAKTVGRMQLFRGFQKTRHQRRAGGMRGAGPKDEDCLHDRSPKHPEHVSMHGSDGAQSPVPRNAGEGITLPSPARAGFVSGSDWVCRNCAVVCWVSRLASAASG